MQSKNIEDKPICKGIILHGNIITKDRLEDNWIALGIAILFYREITPEQAFRLLSGNTKMRRMCKEITPAMVKEIKQTTSSILFRDYKRASAKFGVSEDVIKKIKEENK